MSATLTTKQNELVRAGAEKLVKRHKGNISSAARALGKDQSWLNKLIKEGSGGSLETATLIARELGVGVADLLDLPREPLKVWRDLPGFDVALVLAKATASDRYSDNVWEMVGDMHTVLQPEVIDLLMLLDAARLLDGLYAKKLTSGSDTSPPSGRGGGHKKSSGRIRKR